MTETAGDNQKGIVKEAVRQFVDARLRGEKSDIDEFIKKYPGFESPIRKGIQELQRIDALFDSIVRADESDFKEIETGQDLVGRKIGNFEIVEMIGRGGMGVVYLAHDTKLKRSVAIKSIPSNLTGNATAQARFRREAQLLASLNHPNIGVIHDIIELEDRSGYLVLEHVPGETLAERIAREPLTFEETLSIGRQIAEAVSAAHRKGVVHRDLKPGNIKITPDGQIKVLDFGLAKPLVSENESSEITETQSGRIIGTPAYMSPEQARGKPTDHRTDIWSFGCIMYQMLTGHLPFDGESATDTLARIIERQPDWKMLPQDTPTEIRALLHRCLEKNPTRRLGNITDASVEISNTLTKTATTSVQTIPTKSRRMTMVMGAIVIILLTGAAIWFGLNWDTESSAEVIRLVVLPFENLGPANDEDYSRAISAEIVGRLVGKHGLAVSSGDITENRAMLMGKELDVDYVLKGTIQCVQFSDPNHQMMRIRPQLIRISDGQYVWAKPYDKDMSQIHQIPSELAEKIGRAMGISSLDSERLVVGSLPTENKDAYVYYLRGNDYWFRGKGESKLRMAIQMYEKAVHLDRTFVLAYCQLSRCHMMMFWDHRDRSKKRLEMAERAVERARQLNPELPEVHLALGHYYYHGHLDYDSALYHFAIARKSQPNNSDLLSYIGFVQRRQGRFEEGLANIKKACELNPLSHYLATALGETYLLLRRYPEAEEHLDRAISLAPNGWTYALKARLYLCWEGNTKKARKVLDEALENIKKPESMLLNSVADYNVYCGNYQGALGWLSLKPKDTDGQFDFIPIALRYAQIYGYMNKKELAKKYYEEARSILETKIEEWPEDARFHSTLGLVYAGLGRKGDAIREGKRAVELLPVTKEAYKGTYRVQALSKIYVMVGEYNAAIDQLEFLLSIPGDMSIPLLRVDPAWDPLRHHPRFQKLLESAQEGQVKR